MGLRYRTTMRPPRVRHHVGALHVCQLGSDGVAVGASGIYRLVHRISPVGQALWADKAFSFAGIRFCEDTSPPVCLLLTWCDYAEHNSGRLQLELQGLARKACLRNRALARTCLVGARVCAKHPARCIGAFEQKGIASKH